MYEHGLTVTPIVQPYVCEDFQLHQLLLASNRDDEDVEEGS
jgi:hypothetical protein